MQAVKVEQERCRQSSSGGGGGGGSSSGGNSSSSSSCGCRGSSAYGVAAALAVQVSQDEPCIAQLTAATEGGTW